MRLIAFFFLRMCAPGTGVDDTADTGDMAEVDDIAGVYTGEALLEVPFWSWETCTGPLTLVVDAEGYVEGDSTCVNADSGTAFPLSFTGEVDGEGRISGEVLLAYTYVDGSYGEYTDPLEGDLTGEVLSLVWQTHVTDDPEKSGIVLDGYGDTVRE